MKILVAVESEYFADEQVKFITEHAWPEELSFKILHMIEPSKLNLKGFESTDFESEVANIKEERGKKLVKETAQKIKEKFPKAKVNDEVKTGDPKDCLLEAIESWKADTIIVGSHGRREEERSSIGSVSNSILAYAKCSVIVVRPYIKQKSASRV